MGTKSKVDRVKETLDAVVDLFLSGDVPATVQKAVFPAPNIPIAKWSLRNRVLAALAETIHDASRSGQDLRRRSQRPTVLAGFVGGGRSRAFGGGGRGGWS
ncbi:MAG: hypothetical protein O7H41_08730, partial [Planctomycetota bacterium]|nr:hypothetical protein [Planctomycetota bacterium]